MPRDLRALARVAAASVVLAPFALLARAAGVAARARLEVDRAAGALRALGVVETPRAIARLGGGRSNAVYRVEFAGRTVVLKQGLLEGTVLALGARWAGPQPYAIDLSATARIAREARALRTLAAAGVRVPRVIAVDAARGLLLMEHLEGVPLPTTLAQPGARGRIEAYARALAAVHGAGLALADAHPGNALVTPAGEIVLIDLEFAQHARELGDAFPARCAFDRAYAAAYFTPDERVWFEAAGAPTAPDPRIDDLDLLFLLERRRQRRASTLALTPTTRRAA